MKLENLEIHPAPISDAIFLGEIKGNLYTKKIDFTKQFYQCLAEFFLKNVNKSDDEEYTLKAEIQSGYILEIKAKIKEAEKWKR